MIPVSHFAAFVEYLHYNKKLKVTLCLTATSEGKALIDSVMTSVKGGSLESAVAMRAQLNRDGVMDVPTYQNWARSINDAPALINSEVKDCHPKGKCVTTSPCCLSLASMTFKRKLSLSKCSCVAVSLKRLFWVCQHRCRQSISICID